MSKRIQFRNKRLIILIPLKIISVIKFKNGYYTLFFLLNELIKSIKRIIKIFKFLENNSLVTNWIKKGNKILSKYENFK